MKPSLPRTYALALLVSAVLGVAIIPSRGHYRADAMALVFVALGVVVWLLVEFVRDPSEELRAQTLERLVAVVLGAFIVTAMIDQKLLIDLDRPWWSLRALSLVELVLVATYLRGPPAPTSRWPTIRFALFGICVLLATLETVRLSPVPRIDVWTVQTAGAEALLAGKNPYEVVRVINTGPEFIPGDVPYVYPPLQIFVTVPGLLLGDVRFTMGSGVIVLGLTLRDLALRSGRRLPPLLVDAPALIVWLTPKLLFILQQGWIDPVQLALIAVATALAARRHVWPAAIAFGLVLASKQTMFWVAPLAFAAFPIFRLRHAVVAVGLAGATYLPFVLLNWPAVYHANFGLVASLKPRADALSFVNWAYQALGVRVPYAIAFPLAGGVVGYVLLRRRAELRAFGIALLLTYFAFFTLNKWTFANYYFSLVCMGALGAALSLYPTRPSHPSHPSQPS